MHTLSVKTGDLVRVTTGKDKGKTGKVLQVFPKLQRVAVEGVNVMKRHLKSRRAGDAGQAVEFPMPIHVSNVVRLQGEPGETKSSAS